MTIDHTPASGGARGYIRLLTGAVVAAVCAFALAACGGDDSEGETTVVTTTVPATEEVASEGTTTTDEASTATETETTPTEGTTTETSTTPTEGTTETGTALGSTETTIAEVPVSVEVTELVRQDQFATLNFTVTNTSSRASETFYHSFDDNGFGTATDGLLLIDPGSGTEYRVVRNPGEGCLCSDELPFELGGNKAVNLYATFEAPPADVSEMNVSFPGTVGTITGVPLA